MLQSKEWVEKRNAGDRTSNEEIVAIAQVRWESEETSLGTGIREILIPVLVLPFISLLTAGTLLPLS